MVPAQFLEQLRTQAIRFPSVRVHEGSAGVQLRFNQGTPTRPILGGLTSLDDRFQWMADNEIDRQVVGGWLDIFGYDLDPGEGAEWAAALSEALRTEANDSRLVALATLPLQDPDRAALALRDLVKAGMPGVMVATRVAGRELDHEAFTPFWQTAHETAAVVFLHPGFGATSNRYHDYGLVNGLGRLEDTTVTLARLLYAGIPERYCGARIVVAHGGAALPYVLGRLVRNHSLNPDTMKDPIPSLRQLRFDSVVFDPTALEFLTATVGAERVLLGSDYPFPIGDLTPRTVVRELDADRRARVERENAWLLLPGRS
jgi:aminocarboxymuconate-semialdehyde decarboxylase